MLAGFASIRAAYRVLLVFYPQDLRQQFGEEMAQVFAEQISGEWNRHSATGIARVGLRAVWEVISVAMPLQLKRRFAMRGQTLIATVAIVLGALETAGGVQELVYQGIFNSRTYPLVAGTLGTVAGILLLAAGIAFLVRSGLAVVLASAAAYVAVPVFIQIGIVTRIAGWPITMAGILFPLLLFFFSRNLGRSGDHSPALSE
jgi:hypothetical protein